MLFACVLKYFLAISRRCLSKLNYIKNSKNVIHFEKPYLGSLVLPFEGLPLRGRPTVKVLGITKSKLNLKIMKFVTNFEKGGSRVLGVLTP